MKQPPEKIYLQFYDEDGFEPSEEDEIIPHLIESDEPTWCEDSVNEYDVEYIRKDIYDELVQLLVRHHNIPYLKDQYDGGIGYICKLCSGKIDRLI